MTQQNINVGTGPDSYTGESLRTAFQKVNDNFSQLYAGNVGANISGNIITANGFVTSGNVVTGNVTAAGNISAYYFTGDGSKLTGIIVSANTGNIAFSNLTISGNIAGNIVLDPAGDGNVSIVSDVIPAANVTYNLGSSTRQWKDLWLSNSTLYLGGFPVTVSNTGALSVNGSPVTSSYGNANVTVFLPTYTGAITSMTGNLTTTANVQGAFLLGNGSQLTGLPATYSNTNVTAFLPTYSGLLGGTLSTVSQPNITAVGILTSLTATNDITTTSGRFIGNGSGLTAITGANVNGTVANATYTVTAQFVTGLTGANVTTALGYVPLNSNSANTYSNTNVTAFLPTYSGNVGNGSGYFFGNGSQLTGLSATYSNANVASYLPTYTGNISSGNISTGTITLINGAVIKDTTGLAIGYQAGYIGQRQNAVAIGVQAGYTGQGNNAVAIGSFTGVSNQGNNSIILNATGGVLDQTTANTFTVAPVRNDVSTANVGQVVFYNTTSKEVTYGNTVNVAGNVTGNYILGNGSQLTGLGATYSNATVAAFLPTYGGNVGNGSGYLFGNGSQLTGLASTTYGNANVALYMTTYGGPINANIITGTANATINGLTVNTSGVFTTTLQAAGGLQATPIGNVTASTGQFTTASATGNITGSALTINNSATIGTTLGVVGNITGGNITTTGIVYGNAAPGGAGTISNAVGYLGIPQNSQSTSYTLALTDQGRHIYLTANSNITIPANSSVSFPIGSAISVVNGPNVRSNILITTDTLYLAANGATGTRSISTYGMFTLVKVTNTIWYINGSGIT